MHPTLLTLEDNFTRLTLCPALGGAIANWQTREGDVPLLRHATADALAANTSRRLGCFPLAPWSNRIGNGGFDTPDGWLGLAPNSETDPLPLHGSAWQQAWDVIEHSPHETLLQLNSSQPFAFQATQRFQLDQGRLRIDLTVTHLDARRTWHGIGLHPYFPRTAGTRLLAPASGVWLSDARKLATEQVAVPEHWDFSSLRALPEKEVDHAFAGWSGHCVIEQPELGYRLHCSTQGCDHYMLFCPVEFPFFCIEPVSHPGNAHHLPGHPGLKLLAAGETLSMRWEMHYQPL